MLARSGLIVLAAPGEAAPDPAGSEPETPADDTGAGASGATPAAAGPAPARVSLMALLAVDRGHSFRVAWTGPAAEGDRIAILAEGEAPDAAVNGETTQGGSPISLTAPDDPGDHEIIYLDGASGQVPARRDLEVR